MDAGGLARTSTVKERRANATPSRRAFHILAHDDQR
jgi:hypothetical protein